MQKMPWALIFALFKAGKSKAARMAMIAMTTSSSIKVNPNPACVAETLSDPAAGGTTARRRPECLRGSLPNQGVALVDRIFDVSFTFPVDELNLPQMSLI